MSELSALEFIWVGATTFEIVVVGIFKNEMFRVEIFEIHEGVKPPISDTSWILPIRSAVSLVPLRLTLWGKDIHLLGQNSVPLTPRTNSKTDPRKKYI